MVRERIGVNSISRNSEGASGQNSFRRSTAATQKNPEANNTNPLGSGTVLGVVPRTVNDSEGIEP